MQINKQNLHIDNTSNMQIHYYINYMSILCAFHEAHSFAHSTEDTSYVKVPALN